MQGNIEMIVQAIEIYRTSMYDTLVLYLAVFPENEIARKDVSVCSSIEKLEKTSDYVCGRTNIN